jgi:hypothetical protein
MHVRVNSPATLTGQPLTFEELFPSFEAVFGASLESVLLEPALERDRAWFRARPNHGGLLRRVTSWELPRELRGRGIAWVYVTHGGRDHLNRTFFNHADDIVASDFDVIEEEVVPDVALEHAYPLLRRGAEIVEQTETAEYREAFEQFPGLVAIGYERVAQLTELDWARSFLGYQPHKGLVCVTLHSPTIRSRVLLLKTFK